MVAEKLENLKMSDAKKKFGWGVRHLQMLCMGVVMVTLFIVRSSMAVAVLAMTDAKRINDSNVEIYEWDKKTQGVVLSSFFWGYMSMQIPAGLLSKRFGGKPIILVALLSNGVLCAILPTLVKFGGWQALCAARLMMGLTQACLFPASHTLVGRWLPKQERTSLGGNVYGGCLVGTIISLPTAGLLAETSLGWKLIFYFGAGLMFATAVIWYAFTANSPSQHRMMTEDERQFIEMDLNSGSKSISRLRTPWGQILRSKPMMALMAAHFGMCGAFILFFVDMPTYLEKGLGISLKSSASLSALPYLGMWLGNTLGAILCEKIYNKGLLPLVTCRKIFNSIGFYGVTILVVVLSCLGPDQKYIAIVTLVVMLFLNGFASGGYMMNHLDLSPNFAGLLLSMTNFFANTNSIVTPILTGIILKKDPHDLSRWRYVFLAIGTLTAITNTIFMVFGSADRQPWDDPNFCEKVADPEEIKPVLNGEKEIEANKQSKEIEANQQNEEKENEYLPPTGVCGGPRGRPIFSSGRPAAETTTTTSIL